MNYDEFLHSKIQTAPETGFEIDESELSDCLKPHQKQAVKWAIKGGRRALFESFGLGKTVQELEFCRVVTEKQGGQALIVLPLGVKQEFTHDAKELLNITPPKYVRNMDEIKSADDPILMTNYERVRDGDIDPKYFNAICLDEASVLRSFGSKTYQTFLNKFQGIKYKLVATATPDPNKYKEIIHYGGFLEVMDTGQALTRYFKRDSTKANHLTLYPHKEEEFWLWVSSWALFLSSPADLGFDSTGYDLPEMKINYHKLKSDNRVKIDKKTGQYDFIVDAAEGLTAAAKEKRDSIDMRVEKMKEIVDANPDEHFILWHDLENERHAIKKAMPEAVEVYGSLDMDIREQRIVDFANGKTRLLATKKEISGQGCNFQKYCHRAIFLGIDYKFNDFIQAIHRIYRFLQTEKVIIDIIYTDNEQSILDELLAKWKRFDEQAEKMRAIIKANGLSNNTIIAEMSRSIGVERVKIEGKNYTAVLNDCVEELKNIESDSVGLIHTSIPFSNHYEYTPSYNDFGHNENNERFFEQMDYLTPELLRVLKPGRVAAIHVKDRVLFGNATGDGMPTIDPFSEMTVFHYLKHGFKYMGRIVVLTDVVRENNQTYRLGWSENCKDGSKMGVGCPEYVLLFRKLPTDTSRAYADEPVQKSKDEYSRAQWQLDAHAFYRSSGNRLISKDELKTIPISDLQKLYRKYSQGNVYDYDEHVELAKELDKDGRLPATFMLCAPASWSDEIWDDINRMRTLNTTQSQRRQAMHVCPLQLDIVERIINRYSNPGDLVLDPFGGLMTVPLMAIKHGRKGYGIELNPDYFRDGVGYLKAEENKDNQISLFDIIGESENENTKE
ncbi:MAG: DNA methyltransferase [Acutalibacteraceae bacterium]|nr:DNA methyltransferase [Acutalibacteraceae bacterium]